MELIGYKCFNSDLTNRYNFLFEVGKSYSVDGEISFGNNGNGFHFCKNLEDTFRYFNALEEDVCVCQVKGYGKIVEYEDDYNGYYDMYSSSNIDIIKKLDRRKIIDIMLNSNELRVLRFIQCFKLNDYEIELFKDKFKNNNNVLFYINYYQINNSKGQKSK